MKVTVVTICYNSEETIEATIQSVLAQDYSDLEYVIIDGVSTDGTLAIIDKYKDRISKIVSEKDKGIYDAMNKGVQHATGDLIGILNSDDIYASNSVVSKIVATIEKENSDACYADLVYVKRENTDDVTRYWKSGAYKKGLFRKGWMPPHPTFFVKKEKYNELGVYNIELKTSADYELMLRFIHKNEIKVAYLPEVITKMRLGGQSNLSISNRLEANREDRMAWKMNGLKPAPFMFIRKPLSKVGQFLKKKKD
jgi:glycosyltransferase involved in cell wall biosynthesis